MTVAVVEELSALIAAVREGWTGPVVESSLLGTADPAGIAQLLVGWTTEHLGTAPAGAEWYHASSGVVVGWTLADGRHVVVKAHERRCDRVVLTQMAEVQRRLVATGFPCATPIAGAAVCGDVWATAETMIDDRGVSADREVGVNAAGLARFVRHAGPPFGADRSLGGFDSGTTNTGDLLGVLETAARRVVATDGSTPMIGHLDWSARNVRWDCHGLQAVFDLDSIGVASEAAIAGRASMTWATTLELGDRPLPGPDEAAEYLEAYQAASGRRFSVSELLVARAAAGSALCEAVRRERHWGLTGPAYDALERCGEHWLESITKTRG